MTTPDQPHQVTNVPRTEPVSDRDTEYDAILHKFTRQDTYSPVFIDSADACHFVDVDGQTYLDAFSQSWYAVAGHGCTSITDAISAQAHNLASIHAGRFSTEPRRALARRLLEKLPDSFRRVYFAANGSDAVEASLKTARLVTGRQGVLSFSGSYHGASMAAMSVTGLAYCRQGFGDPVPGTTFVPYPYCYRCPLGLSYPDCGLACTSLVEQAVLTQGPESIAAIIAEPVQAVGGVVVPPPGYWQRIAEIADRYGIWLIFDEIVTAFGRCGSWFAFERFDTVPNVVTLGKGLTSGYQPLSAAVFDEPADNALAGVPFYHGMTFQGHAVACAAALANLDVLEAQSLIERADQLGSQMYGRLTELKARHPCVGDVRGLGAMWGIEIVQDAATRRPFSAGEPFHDPAGHPTDPASWASEQLLRVHRVHIGSAVNILNLAPPLIFTSDDIDQAFTALSAVLAQVDSYCT